MRLIDANAFNEYLESGKYCENCRNIDTPSCCDCPIRQAGLLTFMRMIDEQPTIEERKTGKWVWTCGGTDCYCSLCKVSPLSYTDACGLDGGSIMVEPMEFCPYCGAKMKGSE